MSKTKFILLIPMTYNDGSRIPRELFDGICDEIFALAGGYTLASTVRGAYRMADGSKQVDLAKQVWIAVHEKQVSELKSLVASIGYRLGQETMYLERTGGQIEFILPKKLEGET